MQKHRAGKAREDQYLGDIVKRNQLFICDKRRKSWAWIV